MNQCREERAIGDLMEIAKRTDRNKFRNQVLNPLLNAGLLEMTIPTSLAAASRNTGLPRKAVPWLVAHSNHDSSSFSHEASVN